MHWILQTGFSSESGWAELLEALNRFECSLSEHQVVPKVGDLIPIPDISDPKVMCIGSYSMRHVAKRNGWTPGVFDLFGQDFKQQRVHWGTHLLNGNSQISTVAKAEFSSDRMFIRPTNDSKYFTGRVFAQEEFVDWRKAVCQGALKNQGSLSGDTEIQISEPVEIYAEYRFWVLHGEIVTQSSYKRGNQVVYNNDVDERFHDFVKARIKEWQPHQAFVIDVCEVPDEIKIVEINTINSSGFYAADLQKFVAAFEAAYSN